MCASWSTSGAMMLRTGVACAWLGCALVDAAAAKGLIDPESPVGATRHEQILQLSDARPLLRIPISWEALDRRPDSVAVDVIGIENPALLPVTLSVYFDSTAGRRDIGGFTLYPADHPGIFKLRITAAADKLLHDAARS